MAIHGYEKELVVAHYNEPMTWLSNIPKDIRITIYSKGEPYENPDERTRVVELPNVGRETHTILHHIVVRWDTLSAYTYFVHGDAPKHKLGIIRELERNPTVKGYWPIADKFLKVRDYMYDPNATPLKPFADRMGVSLGGEFPYGAHMMVERSRILLSERSYFEQLLGLSVLGWLWPWSFEYLWPKIFGLERLKE